MTNQLGLPLAVALKLVAVGAALLLDRASTGVTAIFLLPVMALVVGLTLGRSSRRLATILAAVAGAVNTVGFPLVLWVICLYRFKAGLTPAEFGSLAGLLAIGCLAFAPAAAWFLARKPDGASKIAA